MQCGQIIVEEVMREKSTRRTQAHKKQNEEIAGQRKSMVGSGDRSDKIRTYNYPQARVTDHRINYTVYNLTEIVSGDLFSFTEKLRIAENAEKMKSGNND